MRDEQATLERLTPLRERQVIAAAQRGCAASAEVLVRAHQDRLHAFVWRMVRNNHEAEEIAQDAFLRAFQALHTFDFNFRFSTWLFTIAYRLCLNSMRRRREFSGQAELDVLGADPGEPTIDATLAESEEAARLKKKIWESVDQLTPPQRAAVLLFYREALSCQEIGQVLEMPAATVKSHLHRARHRLKDLLASHLDADWTALRWTGAGQGA